jgi:SecD/SecF fusion protein
MQSKGVVKFFLVVLTLVCLVQYFFMFPTQRVENNAEKYAITLGAGDPVKEKIYRTEYLDSVSSEVVFTIPLIKKFTYQELKSRQLALGLDLKGGMSVVLQVDLQDFIKALSNDSKDPVFLQAMENAKKQLASSQSDFVTLFTSEFAKVSGGKKLADVFAFNESLRDRINFQTSDADVARIIREKADETVDLTFKRLKERIDKLGVVQPNISLDAARDLIVVELPGIDNPERARNFLQAAAKLEFWDVYRISDFGVQQAFLEANDKLKKMGMGNVDTTTIAPPTTRVDTVYAIDSLGNADSSKYTLDTVPVNTNLAADQGPLFDVFQFNQSGAFGSAMMGVAAKNKKKAISEMLDNPVVKSLFPPDLAFKWSKDPSELTNEEVKGDEEFYELYAIKKSKGKDQAPLQGDHVTDARPDQDPQSGEVVVNLKMDNTGAKIWGQMTTAAYNDNNREIAILLDDEVVSAPRVINPITSGDSRITGNFSVQDAKDLANILQVGKLPARTTIIQESLVGPSLGKDNINKSLRAILFGFLIVMIFMLAYYAGVGIISVIALIANIFFIFGTLASIGTVLTLPGIAGIVLTIGMAVDANVIIYERIKEELRAGKSLLAAIRDGFLHSYSAIIDANVTTILTAIVLAYFGLGPIKGFAVVLIIGVLSSMFTAVLLTHLMLDWWTGRGKEIGFWSKWSEHLLSKVNIDWMGKRKYAYAFSGALFVISLLSIFFRGFDLGVDFKGGYSFNVQFEKTVPADDIRNALRGPFGSVPVVKAVDLENTYNITTSYLVDDNSDTALENVIAKLHEGVNPLMGGSVNLDNFKNPDAAGTHITSSSKVGASIADDITNSSFKSAIIALSLIFVYLAVRFNNWRFSLGAVIALFHDVVITLGLFSLFYGILPFSMEVDQAFVAAILTVIGYSTNDTVIVFDRIREFINTYSGMPKVEVFNKAINNTLSRTLLTSGTTLIVVIALFIFGGSTIKGFAFALLIGIGFGTYSSVFIASAVVVDMIKEIKGKRIEKKQEKSFSRVKA